jgi:hypothetical protein
MKYQGKIPWTWVTMTGIHSEVSNEVDDDEFSGTGILYTDVWNMFVLGS